LVSTCPPSNPPSTPEKPWAILAATNNGQDLPIHLQYIVMAAQTRELGKDNAARMVFEDMWEKQTSKGENKTGDNQ
jgi:hypothetical protein